MAGVNLDLFDNDTLHSVDFATDNLGFQPGTDVTQTETLTFTDVVGAGAVPEPSTWAMMLLGFAGLGWSAYRGRIAARTAGARA